MYFGEFLINKGLIDAETLLDATITQLRWSPSVAEIIYKNNLLPKEHQLAILLHQTRSHLDYQQTGKQLGYWDDALAENIQRLLKEKVRPVSVILVDQGHLTSEQMEQALREFRGEDTKVEPVLSPKQDLPSETTSASLTAPSTLDMNLVNEFLTQYMLKVSPTFEHIMHIFSKPDCDILATEDSLQQTHEEMLLLRDYARTCGAQQSASIADGMIQTITKIKSHLSKFVPEELHDYFQTAYDIFMGICISIDISQTDEVSETNSNLLDLIIRLKQKNDAIDKMLSHDSLAS